jgi:hypothetical protein
MKRLFISALVLCSLSMAATAANPFDNIPVSDANGNLSNGTYTVKRFLHVNGELKALVTLTGDLPAHSISRSVQVPVTARKGNTDALETQCDIVHLDFGPVNLNVAGFQLNLSPVTVDLTAEEAPADLVCALFNILGTVSGTVNAITNLLNQILGGLGGL